MDDLAIDDRAPAVVAILVTRDPGPWFEETLAALAAQDYAELSVLVMVSGGEEDPTPRVAAVLPDAYVRRLEEDRGFGAAVDQALGMVEGAAFFLLCHDDCAPDPDALHVLVEESFRSNAGIVCPKMVRWDDPSVLLHVGMNADKAGTVVERVQDGEIDAGQHDAVRDVFLAPGGCTLVRADLFAELGGFDPDIFVLGEDLDLCWRAQVAGARVVVAPAARVRHLEQLASGRRAVPAHVLAEIGPRATEAPLTEAGPSPVVERRRRVSLGRRSGRRRVVARVTLQSLQRRHELHVVMKCYGRFHRARVLPQVVVLSTAEYVIAVCSGQHDRAFAVAHAWRWNLARRQSIREERRAVAATRRFDDAEVRRLQLHGSARLTAYLRRALAMGLREAHLGGEVEAARQLGVVHVEPTVAARRSTVSRRYLVWLAAALVLAFGSRALIANGFPYVGQLLAMPSWATFVHRFAVGWQPSGVGTTDPTSPATALFGLAGFVLLGAMGLVQKIVVLGCIPLGAIGMARLARPLDSARARLVATVAYLALPVAYDALATGQWAGLVAYAAAPWILLRLCRASALEPFGPAGAAEQHPDLAPGRGRRNGLVRQSLALGLLVAVVVGVAPSCSLLMPVIALGLMLGTLVAGSAGAGRGVARVAKLVVGAAVSAGVLLAPWFVVVATRPGVWQVLAGVAPLPKTAPGWGQLLRFAVGPIGHTPLTLGFLVAGALALWIGSSWRLAWAARAWMIVALSLAGAWASGRGWLGPVAVPAPVLLAAAGTGLALAIGLGVLSFDTDLRGHRFGWRQGGAALAALALAVGALPMLAASLGGRWQLPATGYGQAVAWMSTPAAASQGDFRVLWLGDPRALPGAGWQALPGLAYTLSEDGMPDTTGLWPSASPGAAGAIGDAVRAAANGSTVRLGALLAPFGVRYVVLVDSIAPTIPGSQTPIAYPPPAPVEPGLLAQFDLRQVISQGGFDVFVDDAAVPLRAVHTGRAATGRAATGSRVPPASARWSPVLTGSPNATSVTGPVPAGTVLAAMAPGSTWQLVGAGGRVVASRPAFGYGAAFEVHRAGTVTVRFRGSWSHGLAAGGEVVLWLVVIAAIVGRRWWFDWWWGPLRRRSGSADARGASTAPPVPEAPTPPGADEVSGVAGHVEDQPVPDDAGGAPAPDLGNAAGAVPGGRVPT